MKKFLILFLLVLFPQITFGWGEGHDLLGKLLKDYLPKEIMEILSEEDQNNLVHWSHYPDLPIKTMEQIKEIVGFRDVEFLKAQGLKNSMAFHGNQGQNASLVLLIQAFREKNGKKASFYISELSHSFGDEGALNHTPMNNILQCIVYKNLAPIPFSHLKNVRLNPSDLGGCGKTILAKIKNDLKTYKPQCWTTDFAEFIYLSQLTECDSGVLSSEVEEAISYSSDRRIREEEFARLGIYQMRLLLDLFWTAWSIAKTDQKIEVPKDWENNLNRRMEDRLKECNAKNDSVFRELYTTDQKPTRKERIGLLLEPYSLFGGIGTKLSFAGRLITAGSGRVLRDIGFEIVPLNYPTVEENGLPSPDQMEILLLCSGRCRIPLVMEDHLRSWLQKGGKMIWIGGDDPRSITGSLGKALHRRSNHELPVSSKWSLQNEDILDQMKISFEGPFKVALGSKEYRFHTNPNINGFGKAYCPVSIDTNDPDIKPLVWLDNGKEKICISAEANGIIWIPEYLLFPYTISPDTSIGYFPTMRLDSFGSPLVREAAFLLTK